MLYDYYHTRLLCLLTYTWQYLKKDRVVVDDFVIIIITVIIYRVYVVV